MRKLAVLLAVAALTVGLAACGGDDDDAASTTSTHAGGRERAARPRRQVGHRRRRERVPPVQLHRSHQRRPRRLGLRRRGTRSARSVNCKADFKEDRVGRHDPGRGRRPVRRRRRRHHDQRRAQAAGRLLRRATSRSTSACSCARARIASNSAEDITTDTSLKIGTQTGTTNFETASGLWGEARDPGVRAVPVRRAGAHQR